MPGTDRRNSSSSEDASLPPRPQVLQDGTELIPTRSVKVTAPKPAANPLQFIKVGPCDLYKAAQEQIKKVEEIKKVKETVKEESEDWQSNLDNWKCSRRKRQEHIIDRVVEVKKLELEEHERNRRRGKTLTEMMEERTQKGIGPRKASLLSYPAEDVDDLTDLGISLGKKEESTCNDVDTKINVDERNENGGNASNGNGHSSPDSEEYTYERAIQGYKSFAEKNVKAVGRPRVSPPKPGSKIGEKLNELEQVRMRSNSVSDVHLPKVDIHKRRSLFEIVESAETKSPSAERVAKDLGSSSIVKERLSSLERGIEPIKSSPRQQELVTVTIKDRLTELEKQKTGDNESLCRVSSEDVSLSIKERLTSLELRKEGKESGNSNSCSDEEMIAHKDLLSPVSSDREVSSPCVSDSSVKDEGVVVEVEGSSNNSGCGVDISLTNSITEGIIGVQVNEISAIVSDSAMQKIVDDAKVENVEQLVNGSGAEINKPCSDQVKEVSGILTDPNSSICEYSSINSKSYDLKDLSNSNHNNSLETAEIIILTSAVTDAREAAVDESDTKIKNHNDESENIVPHEKVDHTEFELAHADIDKNLTYSASDNENFDKQISNSLAINDDLVSISVTSYDVSSVTVPHIPEENKVDSYISEHNKVSNCTFEEKDEISAENISEIKTDEGITETSPITLDMGEKDRPQIVTSVEESITITSNENSVIVTKSEYVMETQSDPCLPKTPLSPVRLSVKKTKSVIKKPKIRVRKLTPILAAPKTILSPVKSPSDLAIITEDSPLRPAFDEITAIREDVGEDESMQPHSVQGAETSESGIDMEESSLYTDENIDEVLGEDDENDDDVDEGTNREIEPFDGSHSNFDDEIEEQIIRRYENESKNVDMFARFENDLVFHRETEAITRFDQINGDQKETEEMLVEISDDKLEAVNREVDDLLLTFSAEKSMKESGNPLSEKISSEPETPVCVQSVVESAPTEGKTSILNYENVIISPKGPPMTVDGEVINSLRFPLSPTSGIEPPKEKPPPPPPMSDEEEVEPPKTSLRRLDSTKRIKKELRKKRSDFLGIEGAVDDTYLEPQVDLTPPPDMLTLLQEERRLDQQLFRQSLSSEADSAEGNDRLPTAVDRLDKALYMDHGLYRQSICSETDSNHETAESRDSGVELDRHHGDELPHSPTGLSESHSRQSSEPFWTKQEHSDLHSRQSSEPYGRTNISSEEDEITKKEREIIEDLEKEEEWRYGKTLSTSEPADIGDKLAEKLRELEQEKLQLEWARAEEEGRRMADQERIVAKETLLRQQEKCCNTNQSPAPVQDNLRTERERLEQEQLELARARQQLMRQKKSQSSDQPQTGPITSNLRYSMPNLRDEHRVPPSPRHSHSHSSWGRAPSAENLVDNRPLATTNHNHSWGRTPSADNLVENRGVPLTKQVHTSWERSPTADNLPGTHLPPQQMTRTTLQALSAAPRSRIVAGETWMQPKRKPDANKSAYNYQHWLIQEAEHRRITEQQKRDHTRRSLPAQYPSGGHHAAQYSQVAPPTAPYSPASPAPYSPPVVTSPTYHRPHPTHHPVNGVQSPRRLPPSHHTVGLPPINPPPHSNKPLPEAVIQTITQRVHSKTSPKRRGEDRSSVSSVPKTSPENAQHLNGDQERMLSVSGKKKCSHCGEELGRGAAMVIESLRLFYHIDCFKCCVCHSQLGDGLMGTDVRVRNNKLHCHNCYSSDDGVKFSCV